MRLRNKKTGGIWDIPKMRHPTMQEDNISFFAYGKDEGHLFSYKSFAELNAEWEDYEPKEPLIKDEKIREAIRAWAAANRDVSEVIYEYDTSKAYCEIIDNQSEARIRFNFLFINELSPHELYTITELCGEDEG